MYCIIKFQMPKVIKVMFSTLIQFSFIHNIKFFLFSLSPYSQPKLLISSMLSSMLIIRIVILKNFICERIKTVYKGNGDDAVNMQVMNWVTQWLCAIAQSSGYSGHAIILIKLKLRFCHFYCLG